VKRYSDDHVWAEAEAGQVTVGLSRHAAAELGEITFVEMPHPGLKVAPGEALCVIESVKTAADVCTPVGGVVVALNQRLEALPALLNSSPEDQGWICRLGGVEAAALERLMSPEQYAAYVQA
jgi:glycine cleavage system H protein